MSELSQSVDSVGHSELVGLALSAIVPVIEVVAAVVLVSILPLPDMFGLMLHVDALFEFSIVIFASVSSVKRDL